MISRSVSLFKPVSRNWIRPLNFLFQVVEITVICKTLKHSHSRDPFSHLSRGSCLQRIHLQKNNTYAQAARENNKVLPRQTRPACLEILLNWKYIPLLHILRLAGSAASLLLVSLPTWIIAFGIWRFSSTKNYFSGRLIPLWLIIPESLTLCQIKRSKTCTNSKCNVPGIYKLHTFCLLHACQWKHPLTSCQQVLKARQCAVSSDRNVHWWNEKHACTEQHALPPQNSNNTEHIRYESHGSLQLCVLTWGHNFPSGSSDKSNLVKGSHRHTCPTLLLSA